MVRVRLSGEIASIDEGPLLICRHGGPAGCVGGVELPGLAWSDVDGTPWEEVWGRWLPDPAVVDATIAPDGSIVVGEVTSRVPPASLSDTPCEPPEGGWPRPPLRQFEVDPVRSAINDYVTTIAEVFGAGPVWDSLTGVHTIGVVGEPAPHQAALDAAVTGPVCVVSVDHSEVELQEVRSVAIVAFDTWRERGYGPSSVGMEAGNVVVELARFDARLWDDLGDHADSVEVRAFLEVVGSTLDQLPDEDLGSEVRELAPDDFYPSCRGFPVDPAVFDQPADDHADGSPSTSIFETADVVDVFGAPPGVGWWRIYAGPGTENYASEGPDAVFLSARLGRDGSWRTSGGSRGGDLTCEMTRQTPDGLGRADWVPSVPPTADDRELTLSVTERSCASGKLPGERLLDPLIEESAESVVITFSVAPQTGDQDCQGNPPTEVVVVLGDVLGDRELLDGRFLPPRPPVDPEDG